MGKYLVEDRYADPCQNLFVVCDATLHQGTPRFFALGGVTWHLDRQKNLIFCGVPIVTEHVPGNLRGKPWRTSVPVPSPNLPGFLERPASPVRDGLAIA